MRADCSTRTAGHRVAVAGVTRALRVRRAVTRSGEPRTGVGTVESLAVDMARIDPEAVSESELVPVYMAASLTEALQAETFLSERGVDYVVRVEPYGTTLFGSLRHGAWFYVTSGRASYCRSEFEVCGLGPGIVRDAPSA